MDFNYWISKLQEEGAIGAPLSKFKHVSKRFLSETFLQYLSGLLLNSRGSLRVLRIFQASGVIMKTMLLEMSYPLLDTFLS